MTAYHRFYFLFSSWKTTVLFLARDVSHVHFSFELALEAVSLFDSNWNQRSSWTLNVVSEKGRWCFGQTLQLPAITFAQHLQGGCEPHAACGHRLPHHHCGGIFSLSCHCVCIIMRAEATTDDWKPLSLSYRNLPTSARSSASVAPMSNSWRRCSSTWLRSLSSLLPRPRVSVWQYENCQFVFCSALRSWLIVLHH